MYGHLNLVMITCFESLIVGFIWVFPFPILSVRVLRKVRNFSWVDDCWCIFCFLLLFFY